MNKPFLFAVALSQTLAFAAAPVLFPPNTRPPGLMGHKAPYGSQSESREALYRLGEMVRIMNPGALERPITLRVREARPIVPTKEAHLTLRPLIAAACTAVGPTVRVVSLDNEERQLEIIESSAKLPGTPAYNRAVLEQQGSFFTIDAHLTRFDERIDVARRSFLANLLFGLKGHIQVEPSFDLERENEISEMGMEFVLEDQNGFQVPYSQTEVLAALVKGMRKDRIGLLILGSGGQWSGNTARADGPHGLSIECVDRAVLMLLGKLLHVPYWRCLRDGGEPDPTVLAAIKQEYEAMDESTRIRVIQRYLTLCGQPVLESGALDEPTRQGLARFTAKQGLPKSEIPSPEIYLALHLDMPMPFPTTQRPKEFPPLPETGVAVIVRGCPAEYSDLLFSIIQGCPQAIRVERDRNNPFRFRVIDYRGHASKIANYLTREIPKRCYSARTPRVQIDNDRLIHVEWRDQTTRYAAAN